MTPQPTSTGGSTPTRKAKSDHHFGHGELVQAIARDLPSAWTVEIEPTLGLYRADLLISPSNAAPLVVEVNVEPGLVHFAELGEAAASRSGASAAGDVGAHAVLITTGEAPDEIERLARDLDVELIPTQGNDLSEATRASVDGLIDLATRFEADWAPRHAEGDVEDPTARNVLQMLRRGKRPAEIANALGLDAITTRSAYARLLEELQTKNPGAVDDVMRQWQSAPL
jgi:hypothetical protein